MDNRARKGQPIQPSPMIHVYPGMGATSAMYGPLWRASLDAGFHDWPCWRGEQSIGALAERLVAEHGIQDHDVVIGSSLGGMAACEIARLRRLRGVVLIGSARSKEEVSRLLARLHPLAGIVPFGLIMACAARVPWRLARMFARTDPGFIRSMCKAVFQWGGLQTDLPVFRVHGQKDLVIPLPQGVDRVINGGHLPAMTHPGPCIAAIKEASWLHGGGRSRGKPGQCASAP